MFDSTTESRPVEAGWLKSRHGVSLSPCHNAWRRYFFAGGALRPGGGLCAGLWLAHEDHAQRVRAILVRDGVDGFLVLPRDFEPIVDSLALLRANPRLRQEMSHNACEQAQRFTWSDYRKNVVDALRAWQDGAAQAGPEAAFGERLDVRI